MTTFLAIVVFVLVVLEMVPEESDSVPLFCEYYIRCHKTTSDIFIYWITFHKLKMFSSKKEIKIGMVKYLTVFDNLSPYHFLQVTFSD